MKIIRTVARIKAQRGQQCIELNKSQRFYIPEGRKTSDSFILIAIEEGEEVSAKAIIDNYLKFLKKEELEKELAKIDGFKEFKGELHERI